MKKFLNIEFFRAHFALLCVSAWGILFLIRFYPGVVSWDPIFQLTQAITGVYGDWHPPIMAWLLKHLLWTGNALGSLFVLHIFFFACGFWLFISALERYHSSFRYLALMIFLVIPQIIAFQNIMKDNGMLAAYMLFLGTMLFSQKMSYYKQKIPFYLIAILALFYGCAVRLNGILVVLSLALLAIHIIVPKLRFWIKILTGMIVAMLLYFSVQLFTYGFLNAQKTHPFTYVMLSDIFAIDYLTNSRTNLLDNYYGKERVDKFRSAYHFDAWGEFISKPDRDSSINITLAEYIHRDPSTKIINKKETKIDYPYINQLQKLKPYWEHETINFLGFPKYDELKNVWKEKVLNHPFLILYAHSKFMLEMLVPPNIIDKIGIYKFNIDQNASKKILRPIFMLLLYIWGFVYLLVLIRRYFKVDQNVMPVTLTTIKLTFLVGGFGLFSSFILVAFPPNRRYTELTTYFILLTLGITILEYLIQKIKHIKQVTVHSANLANEEK